MPMRKRADGRQYVLSGTQSLVFTEQDKDGRVSMNGTNDQEVLEVLFDRLGKTKLVQRIIDQMNANEFIAAISDLAERYPDALQRIIEAMFTDDMTNEPTKEEAPDAGTDEGTGTEDGEERETDAGNGIGAAD